MQSVKSEEKEMVVRCDLLATFVLDGGEAERNLRKYYYNLQVLHNM